MHHEVTKKSLDGQRSECFNSFGDLRSAIAGEYDQTIDVHHEKANKESQVIPIEARYDDLTKDSLAINLKTLNPIKVKWLNP